MFQITLGGETWLLENVTADLVAEGKAAKAGAERKRQAKLVDAAAELREEVQRRATSGNPMLSDKDGVPFLKKRELSHSPFPRRLLPRVQERPPSRLTDEEAEFMRKMPEPYGFVARLGLGTGLRWAELCRAQSTDLRRGFLVVSMTKSGKVRRVPLTPDLRQEVENHVGKLVPYSSKASGSFARMVKKLTGITRFHPHNDEAHLCLPVARTRW